MVVCGADCERQSVWRCAACCVLIDPFVAEHNDGVKPHIHSVEATG